jgi:hypothetical protein
MIIELPNYVDLDFVSEIKRTVSPFILSGSKFAYHRDGATVNISNTLELKEIDKKLADIFTSVQKNILNLRYKPMGFSGDSGYEYHVYKPGDTCHVHADGEFCDTERSFLRYASVVLHLSTPNEGGDLIFPNQNKSVKTEAGKIVIFPPYGFYQHYTTPSTESREVIVTWFVYNNLNVIKNNGNN